MQPLGVSAWVAVMVGVPPQLSVADDCPATSESPGSVEGLHPKFPPAGTCVTVGGVVSTVQVAVRETVAELPHASVELHVRVWVWVQLLTISVPVETFSVGLEQLSLTVAEPRAAAIWSAVGLQPNIPLAGLPVAAIIGGVMSTVQVTVRATGVAALPQASLAFQVLVWERPHPLDVTVLSDGVGVIDPPQLSVTVAVPRAALIWSAVGLQARVVVVPVAVMTGGVVSPKVMCCRQVATLPQAFVAFHVRSMPGLPVQLAAVAASVWVIVGVPQLSVAVAVPVLEGSVEAPHASTLSAGQVITGAVASSTVTVFWHMLVQPFASVTVRLRVKFEAQLLPAVTVTD
jgi:hypothetical protein